MRKSIFIALLAIVQFVAGRPAVGQTKKQTAPPPKPANGESGQSQTPQRGTETAPFIVQIEHGPHTQTGSAATEHGAAQKDFYDKFGIGSAAAVALFTLALVVVGALGVCAAIRTLRAIEGQGALMKRQADTMEMQVALQRAAMAQWVEITDWKAEDVGGGERRSFEQIARRLDDERRGVVRQSVPPEPRRLWIQCTVTNPTNFPLVLQHPQITLSLVPGVPSYAIQISVDGDKSRMTPKSTRVIREWIDIEESHWEQFVNGNLMVYVRGNLDFMDAMEDLQPEVIYGTLRCGLREPAKFQSQVQYGKSNQQGE